MALTRPRASQIVTTTTDFSDPLVLFNKDQTGVNDKDIGIILERGSDTNVGIIWDESVDRFALINTTETGSTVGNVTISSYANLTIGSLISSGLNYPTSDGTFGQVLTTNGSGTLSFTSVTASPAGSNTQLQFNNNGSLGASANLTFDGTTLTSSAFSGPLTGNVTGNASTATSATNATNFDVEADNTTNATHYVIFTGGATGNQRPNSDTDLTYNPSTNTLTATNFAGQATSAQYADLAENYLADQAYPIGTVLQIGGAAEVTIAIEKNYGVVGTVSDKPGYLMNSNLEGEHVTPVAYIGRVPCRVKGIVRRGELLVVSDTPGVAITKDPRDILPGQLVGKALQEYTNNGEGIIEILVGRL